MLIMAVHRCGPFIWRFQSPHHRQTVLFYYFNINCASSGHRVIIFPAIRHREAGWRESGLWPVVREEWQPRGRRAPVPGPRPGLRGWAQRGTERGRPAGETLHTALLHTCSCTPPSLRDFHRALPPHSLPSLRDFHRAEHTPGSQYVLVNRAVWWRRGLS